MGNIIKLGENLCRKNFPKSSKISNDQKKSSKLYIVVTVIYVKYRGLGNSEVLTSNPALVAEDTPPPVGGIAGVVAKMLDRVQFTVSSCK